MKKDCERIWEIYLSRKLNQYEPEWTHYAYELVFKHINNQNLSQKDLHLIQQIIKSHSLPDGYSVPAIVGKPNGDFRIIHDGWKAGTPTWIFMGRKQDTVFPLKNDWIAVKRTLPTHLYDLLNKELAPDTLWLAYHLKKQMKFESDESCIGPAISYEQLINEMNRLGFTNSI